MGVVQGGRRPAASPAWVQHLLHRARRSPAHRRDFSHSSQYPCRNPNQPVGVSGVATITRCSSASHPQVRSPECTRKHAVFTILLIKSSVSTPLESTWMLLPSTLCLRRPSTLLIVAVPPPITSMVPLVFLGKFKGGKKKNQGAAISITKDTRTQTLSTSTQEARRTCTTDQRTVHVL